MLYFFFHSLHLSASIFSKDDVITIHLCVGLLLGLPDLLAHLHLLHDEELNRLIFEKFLSSERQRTILYGI